VTFGTLGGPWGLAAADLDGNGLTDVVVSHINPGGLAVHLATCQ
jgi:FG-GAP repeat protein